MITRYDIWYLMERSSLSSLQTFAICTRCNRTACTVPWLWMTYSFLDTVAAPETFAVKIAVKNHDYAPDRCYIWKLCLGLRVSRAGDRFPNAGVLHSCAIPPRRLLCDLPEQYCEFEEAPVESARRNVTYCGARTERLEPCRVPVDARPHVFLYNIIYYILASRTIAWNKETLIFIKDLEHVVKNGNDYAGLQTGIGHIVAFMRTHDWRTAKD